MVAYTEQSVAALRQTVRRLLQGEDDVRTTVPGVDEAAFLAAAERHRLVVFLALRQEQLRLTPELAAAIQAAARGERIATLGMARALHQATDALTAAGVRVLSFKGLALAAQAHGDFSARGSGDLDLLVPPSEIASARATLAQAGWAPDSSYPAPGPTWAWRHTVRNYYEIALHRSGLSIDLHWHLGLARSTAPSFDTLWARRTTVAVGGRDVATLSVPDAWRHSAMHAAKDEWGSLRSLVDVRLLGDAVDPTEDATVGAAALATLGVVRAQLGGEHGGLAPARAVKRAEALQASAPDVSTGRFPGHRTLLGARRLARGVSTTGDLRRLAAVTVAHPSDLGHVGAITTGGAVLAVARVRAATARRRIREWRHT
ncbi:MAG: nucleotidyltransferase family protein [Nocardioides alkalitolerans]